MYEWQKQIQIFVDEIDKCIKNYNDEALTLSFLSRSLGIPNSIRRENLKRYRVCSFGIT